MTMVASRTKLSALVAVGALLVGTLSVSSAASPRDATTEPPASSTAADVAPMGSSTRATIGGRLVWAHFSNPRSGSDYTIIDELRRLIRNTPSGGNIRGAIHSISIDGVASDLVNARNRGVDVRLVIDAKNANSDDGSVALLRQLPHRFCTNSNGGRACISTSPDGDMHTKMFTFSSTKDPNGTSRDNVSWFSSSNLTYATGPQSFNNAITVYGAPSLREGLNANFSDMYNRRHYAGNDYYDAGSGRGYYLTNPADVYASPEGAGQTDTIVNRLNDVTPDSNCRLRIGMANVTAGRPGLVNQVKRFREGGCRVWMVVGGSSTDGINMTQSVYNELLGAGIYIRRMDKIHDKYFTVYGKFNGTYRYRVYTGSQNWTQDALNENDEIFVKMGWETGSTHPLFDAFMHHFNSGYFYGKTCTVSNYPCR